MTLEQARPTAEVLSSQTLYEICYQPLVKLTDWELLDRFYREIVPRMDRRSRGGRPISQHEVMLKMWGRPGARPGEAQELTDVILDTGYVAIPQFLGEIADMVYRVANPNCPPFFRGSLHLLLPRINFFEGLRLCCAKYNGRLTFGDTPDIKEIEMEALGLLFRDMSEHGFNLFLKREESPKHIDLYRLWLTSQPHRRMKLMADRVKEFWPF